MKEDTKKANYIDLKVALSVLIQTGDALVKILPDVNFVAAEPEENARRIKQFLIALEHARKVNAK